MKKYEFSDNDDDTNEEHDIVSEDYSKLIHSCFQHSRYFSCDFSDKSYKVYEQLKNESFDLPYVNSDIRKAWESRYKIMFYSESGDGKPLWRRRYFLCNETTKEWLLQLGSVFGYFWNASCNPENLIFYRDDDSVFFSSITHEGYCFVFPESNENIDEILANRNWKQCDINDQNAVSCRKDTI